MAEVKVSLPYGGINLPVSRIRIDGRDRGGLLVTAVKVYRAIGKHDSAQISCQIASSEISDLDGKPISFIIGSTGGSTQFYGYIYSIEKEQKLQTTVTCTLSCIGATAVTKRPVFGLVKNATAESIAKRVLSPDNIGYYSAGSSAAFPRLSLTGRTGWSALTHANNLSGRMLSFHEGAVWLFDPITELEEGSAVITLQKSIDNQGSGGRRLLDFLPSTAATFPKPSVPRAAWFSSSGEVVVKKPLSPLARDTFYITDTYIPSSTYAEDLFKRIDRQNSLAQTATARILGTSSLCPGNTVDISTGAVSLIQDSYDGLWVATEVTHEISDGLFQTSLKLVRDKYRPTKKNIPYKWFYTRGARPHPSMSLSNGAWISSWRNS